MDVSDAEKLKSLKDENVKVKKLLCRRQRGIRQMTYAAASGPLGVAAAASYQLDVRAGQLSAFGRRDLACAFRRRTPFKAACVSLIPPCKPCSRDHASGNRPAPHFSLRVKAR
jgi:hypothetical protein